MDDHTAAECGGPEECTDPLAHPALTDSWQIQLCAENRADNVQADYCVSAYCPRCQLLRAANGVSVIIPNAWMFGPSGEDYRQGLAQRIADSGR
jgi:hypothetical protein